MRTTIKSLLLAVLVMVAAIPALAQTATTRTVLSTALSSGANNNQVSLLSVTGISASTGSTQTYIAICDGIGSGNVQACEQMQVRSISGTTLTVTRAVRGNATAHVSGSVVWYGTAGNFIQPSGNTSGVFVPATPSGTCVRTSNQFLPVVNPNTGDITDCLPSTPTGTSPATTATTDQWMTVNGGQLTNFFPLRRLPTSASTYTAALTDTVIGVNTAVASTITLPACTGCGGKWYFIMDMAGNMNANAPVTITIAGSANQLVNSGASASLVPSAVAFAGNFVFFDDTSNSWYIGRTGLDR